MTTHVLVVEDSEAKLASIVAALREILPGYEVETARSVRSAITALQVKLFSLIIVDMSLPTFDIVIRERGGTPRPFGGIEVFDYLAREELCVPIIVVSSYAALVDGSRSMSLEKLAANLGHDYPENYQGYVYFDSTYSNWEREFRAHVEKILK